MTMIELVDGVLAKTAEDGRATIETAALKEGPIMDTIVILAEIKIDIVMKELKGDAIHQAMTGELAENKEGQQVMAAIGIPEAVTVESLEEVPGMTQVTRIIIPRMNGEDKEVKAGLKRTTRWKKMMGIVRLETRAEVPSPDRPEKMMKACENYLRISSRICIGLKKH
jgi:hypothetical protein